MKVRRRPGSEDGMAGEGPGAVDGVAHAEAREGARRVAEALSRLAMVHRVVLALFAVEGLSHREIAEVLGVPEGTDWSRLHTARKHLAAVLGPSDPP